MTHYTFPVDAASFADTGIFIKADGSRLLSGDWDVGAGRKIQAEQIQARSNAGLKLYEDGGFGIFIKDSDAYVGIWTETPDQALTVADGTIKIIGSGVSAAPFHLVDTQASGVTYYVDNGYPAAGVFGIRDATTTRLAIKSGNVGIDTTAPTAMLDVNSDLLRLRTAKTPASAGATGNAGDICWDSNYVYVCVATNTWKRAAIATW